MSEPEYRVTVNYGIKMLEPIPYVVIDHGDGEITIVSPYMTTWGGSEDMLANMWMLTAYNGRIVEEHYAPSPKKHWWHRRYPRMGHLNG